MNEELKRCSTCGSEANKDPFYVNLISCSNVKCKNYLMFFDVDTWQSRPIEDQLEMENAKLLGALEYLEAYATLMTNQQIREYVHEALEEK